MIKYFVSFLLAISLLRGDYQEEALRYYSEAELQLELGEVETAQELFTIGKNLEGLPRTTYNDFDSNPYITKGERAALSGYILPYEHPIRSKLDKIFKKTRASQDLEHMKAAGFQIHKTQSRSFIIVASHPSVPGYLFKLHLDNEKRQKLGHPGWWWFKERIVGAREIARTIRKKKLTMVKTPQKWVYPLPENPSPPASQIYDRKNFILVVERFNLLEKQENLDAWKNSITVNHLQDLYTVLKKCGGKSMRPSNIPFSKDGKICFIDTEYPGASPDYGTIRQSLSPKMQRKWDEIVHN